MTEHHIRIIQPRLRDGDIAGNLAMALKTIRASAGQADLLVFPETCVSGFPRPDNVAQLAEPLDGPSATALREAARQAGVAVAIGLAEADQGRHFNAGLLIDGVPAEVAAANASWMDADPERVAEARAARADAVPFKG